MSGYMGWRAVKGMATMFVIISLAFLLLRVLPGDPAEIWLDDYATPELVKTLRQQLGLDKPIWQQYVIYLGQVVRGQLGYSFRSQMAVRDSLVHQYPYTIRLTIVSLALSLVVGLPLGVHAAIRRNTIPDLISSSVGLLWVAAPPFWLGLLLLLLFSVHWTWFPLAGAEDPRNLYSWAMFLFLPAVTSAARQAAVCLRMMRSSMLDVLREDYIRTARAKGLNDRVVLYKHALKNAINPIVSITGVELSILLGGSVVIETVFSRPGIGRLLITAIAQRDYPLIQGTLLVFAVSVVVINLATDILYSLVDPRIRYG